MPKYKLLALDLDGTVLTDKKTITNETKHWISKAEEAGVIVIFATGRGFHGVEQFRGELDLNTPMVLANGGELWKTFDDLLERKFIIRKDIHMLQKLAKEFDASHVSYNGDFSIKSDQWTDQMFDLDWVTFSILHEDINVIKELQKRVDESETLEMTSSAAVNIEFSLKGVSKESGVLSICDFLGISMEEVMAIGDNMNDINLLRAAGLGIAMGNAESNVKKIADGVTATNEEDGVAKAIQKYLLI